MSHSFFSPSKGSMWMECVGALAMPENQEPEQKSSTYADDGTASHTLLAWCFDKHRDADDFPHSHIKVGGKEYEIDDARKERVQSVVDDVRREALGGLLFYEYRVDLSRYLGMAPCWTCYQRGHTTDDCPQCKGSGEEPQGGTSDIIVIQPRKKLLIVGDLKDGQEKVYAAYTDDEGKLRINHQLGLYGVGVLEDIMLLGYDIDTIILRIYQPKLNWIDEIVVTPDELVEFAVKAQEAMELSGQAMTLPVGELDDNGYLNPGEKTCRWCAAKVRCPAYRRFISETTKMDFEDEGSEPVVPQDTSHLAVAYAKVDMVEQWCRAVRAQTWNAVQKGETVVGKDGEPLKFVEGKQGNRKWDDPEKAEAALVGQLGDKAYEPRKIITAPAADKLLNKKKTKHTWTDVFEPLITRARGGMQLVLGSDPRPPYNGGVAQADEFNEEIGVDE